MTPSSRSKKRSKKRLSPWKLAGIFVLVVLGILGALVLAVYVSLSQAIITIIPKQEVISTTFSLQLGQTTTVQEGEVIQLAGTLFDRQIEETKEIQQLDKQEIDAQAGGRIRMVNGRDGTIRLVKNTQLRPENRDMIFRIQDDVAIPAGGEIEVDILADETGEIGNVPATKFEIIKLFDGWKQDVYAISDEPMSGGRVVTEVLTDSQIDAFKEEYKNELSDKILEEIISEHPDLTFPEDGVAVEVDSIESSASPGEQVENVELTANLRLVAFAFQEHALLDVALARLKQEIPDGYEFLGVTQDSFGYVIDSYDIERGTAAFTVSVDGVALASIDPESFDRSALEGRDSLEAANYFEQFDTIESVDVYFAPFWTETIPALESHTEIVIEKPLPLPAEPTAVEAVQEDIAVEPEPIPANSVENEEQEVPVSEEDTLPDTEHITQ